MFSVRYSYEAVHMIRKAKRAGVRRMRRSVYCTASFSVCSLRRPKFPIICPGLRLDCKVATHPLEATDWYGFRWHRNDASDKLSALMTANEKGRPQLPEKERMMSPSPRETHAFLSIQLPLPASDRGASVFAALEQRKTTREISATPLPIQLLSNLLWAAFGVNRKRGPFGVPGRTAASASNSQEIDLYVAVPEGVYLYDALNNLLAPIVAGDLRVGALTPGQRGVEAKAPVQLIYVVDVHRLTHTAGFQEPGLQDPEVQKSYYYVDTGLIAGNVYLFAAAQGLAAWFHNCDTAGLAQRLGLRAEQRVLFAQSIGYPEKD